MSIKVEALVGNVERPFEYGNVFCREHAGGGERLKIGLNDGQDACALALMDGLRGPFQLLFVLHTTRTGAGLGRYESPELTAAEAKAFIKQFGRFLSEDARHDFWVRSHKDDATIVLDRHNVIYGYGPLDAFESALRGLGVRAGETPAVPDPHVHYYHPEWDDTEREILGTFDWHVKPLRETDVQIRGSPSEGHGT